MIRFTNDAQYDLNSLEQDVKPELDQPNQPSKRFDSLSTHSVEFCLC